MQTILGAGGVIGKEVAASLSQYTDSIRLVSRHPVKVNSTDELLPADLTDAEQTAKAVAGSEIAYLTVGLQYRTKVWQVQWPAIMKNVMAACKKHNTKLVFFDNVYSYGLVKGWMTEETPYRPVSKKGLVRNAILEMLLGEVKQGNIQALIARAADFYGPGSPLSFFNAMVMDNLAKGKKAMWMMNDNVKHSMTYTPDAGKATAMLGNTPDAFGRVWHLPTNNNARTGRQLIELAAKEFGTEPNYTLLKKWMLAMVSVFNPLVRESLELLYQNSNEYLFDSSDFCKKFDFQPVSYQEGLILTAESYRKQA